VDNRLPRGYVPFNVQAIGKDIVVTYALQQQGSPLEADGPSLASISTRNNSVTRLACFGDSVTTQANWMISFLPPNQGIGVG
jgi:hypothetical protein